MMDLPRRTPPSMPPHSFADKLHPEQFKVPISEILKMHSDDAYFQDEPGKLVRHTMRQKRRQINAEPEYYGKVKESMAIQGQTAPLSVGFSQGKNYLTNGHHRLAIAMDLGWTHMNVQRTDPATSMDRDFDAQNPHNRRLAFEDGAM